jgi:flagellar biosynthesis protein FlhG
MSFVGGDSLPPPPVEPTGSPRTRRILAFGGGRAGVGRTLLAANLGVYFAQLGREVLVCDADPNGSSMHAVLGLDRAPFVAQTDSERGPPALATSVPGLRLLAVAYDPLSGTPTRPSRGTHLLRALQKADADYVIVNLGASTSPASLDMFLEADLGVCVTMPEPLAVEMSYRFLRGLWLRILRKLVMKERFRLRIVERVLASLGPLASPLACIREMKRVDDTVASIAAEALVRVRPQLVVGQTRLRSDLELGPAMAVVSERYFGVPLDYLGHVEHDDAVWLTVRRRQPLLIDSPTSRSARNIERVARRILAILAAPRPRPLEARSVVETAWSPSPRTLYDVLGVARGATDDEIRRAYKRQCETFQPSSLPVLSVVPTKELEDALSRIEEAYDTLLDAQRRRAYDLSVFPDDAPDPAAQARSRSDAEEAELALLQAELSREIGADTEFTGELLARVRAAADVSLDDISKKTKISVAHLRAMEAEEPRDLPAAVYVQGFVQQLARYLQLDVQQVTRTYMRRFRALGERQK